MNFTLKVFLLLQPWLNILFNSDFIVCQRGKSGKKGKRYWFSALIYKKYFTTITSRRLRAALFEGQLMTPNIIPRSDRISWILLRQVQSSPGCWALLWRGRLSDLPVLCRREPCLPSRSNQNGLGVQVGHCALCVGQEIPPFMKINLSATKTSTTNPQNSNTWSSKSLPREGAWWVTGNWAERKLQRWLPNSIYQEELGHCNMENQNDVWDREDK